MMGEGLDDNQIFTLTVLLASVLIYNSAGLPTRHDLNGLEYPSTSFPGVLTLFIRKMDGRKFAPFPKIYLGTFDRSIVANVMCRFQGNRILFDRPFGVFTLMMFYFL